MRFNNFRGDILDRFDYELPFSWDTVCFADWRSAARELEVQVKTLYGDEQGSIIFPTFLKSRVADLTTDFGSLFYMFGIIQAGYFDEEKHLAELLRLGLGPQASDRLFKGQDSYLNKLRTRCGVEVRWPDELVEMIAAARKDTTISEYVCPQELGNKGQVSVVNLPLILAVQVVIGKTDDWFSNAEMLSHLVEYKAFDPDWFDDAFNETIARCLSNGLFD